MALGAVGAWGVEVGGVLGDEAGGEPGGGVGEEGGALVAGFESGVDGVNGSEVGHGRWGGIGHEKTIRAGSVSGFKRIWEWDPRLGGRVFGREWNRFERGERSGGFFIG